MDTGTHGIRVERDESIGVGRGLTRGVALKLFGGLQATRWFVRGPLRDDQFDGASKGAEY